MRYSVAFRKCVNACKRPAIQRHSRAGSVAKTATKLMSIAVAALMVSGLLVSPAQAQVEVTLISANPDRDTLMALYDSAGGDGWHNNTNWNSSAPLGDWHGVTTDADGSVRQLDLSQNNLIGTIPTQIGDLASLELLELADNALSGEIPPQIGNLENLRRLNLSGNSLTGSLPPQISFLGDLSELYLGWNHLSDTLPVQLGALTNLKRLALNDNEFHGTIPRQLGELSQLQYLNLARNNLARTIPARLSKLTELRFLFLEGNQLVGRIPPKLGDLTKLRFIYLNDNQLSGRIPVEFAGISNSEDLRRVYLNNNKLSGQLPSGFGKATSLWRLWLNDNEFTGQVPASLLALDDLFSLRVEGNGDPADGGLCIPDTHAFDDWLDRTPSWFGERCTPVSGPSISDPASDREVLEKLYSNTDGDNWTHSTNWNSDADLNDWHGVITDANGTVTHLILSDNNLTGSLPPEIGELANLEHLFLDGNDLTGEIPATISMLTNLESLNLDRNSLSGSIPATIGRLTDLKFVSLDFNKLTGDIPIQIGSLTNLEALYAHGNSLTGEIPETIRFIDGLRDLDLAYNQLTGEITTRVTELTELQYLELSGNELTGQIPGRLVRMSDLVYLLLSENELSGDVPSQIGQLPNLTYLYLDGNNLAGEIPAELGALEKLGYLYLNDNQLTGSVPTELGNLEELWRVDLSGNDLMWNVPGSFLRLGHLLTARFDNGAADEGGLCLPGIGAFNRWRGSIPDWSAEICPDRLVYIDIANHTLRDDITDMYYAGVFGDEPDNNFRPDDPVTRGEFASMLAGVLGLSASDDATIPSDAIDHDHAAAIAALVEAEMFKVDDSGLIMPDQRVTRAEVAAVFADYLSLRVPPRGQAFSDIAGHEHTDAIRAAAVAEIIEGYPDGTFKPERPVTRAEIATIFKRALFADPEDEE